MLSKVAKFQAAAPVWAKGYTREMNIGLVLEKEYEGTGALLRIACCSCYQLFADGDLIAAGPARAGHGFFRVDEIALPEGKHTVRVLVLGYNNNGFQYPDQPSFVCAELILGGQAAAFTAPGRRDFAPRIYAEKIQKTQRFSFQRNFAEAYDLSREKNAPAAELTEPEEDRREFLERGVDYYTNDYEPALRKFEEGTCEIRPLDNPFMDRAIVNISPALMGFPKEELELCTAWEAQKVACEVTDREEKNLLARIRGGNEVPLKKDSFATFDMGKNLCGFIGLEIEAEEDCTVIATFDEIMNGGRLEFLRLGTSSAVVWKLPKGKYSLLSFEPYVFRYLRIAVLGSASLLRNVHLRRVGFYRPNVTVKTDNEKLKAVFEAALETFRQNTYDVYTDCASRERAGWLCDSFFTSRVEYTLTGESKVERNFLENFLLPDSFKCLPKGMLPMCYPSDHYDGVYIPNWAMWYVVELEEYFARTGDRELIDRAKDRVYGLLEFFRGYENGDGLLEKLDSWVFLEWSKSNELVQDINFPSNMLYVKMKRAIAHLYQDDRLLPEADKLAETIREKSFMGKFFCDNMVYKDGVAVLSGECTESCQYYAFHTGVATPEDYPQLWNTLVNDFGPARKENNKYPEIYFANAFIGNYLRLDLLDRYGYRKEILDNMEGYFYYMAEKTGTLWENDTDYASCAHGFASHVIYWMDRLGMLERN